MKIKPLGRRILIRKCVSDHIRDENGKVLIYMTDTSYEECNTAEIVDIADDCRMFTKEAIGAFIQIPERIEGVDELDIDKGLFFIQEDFIDNALQSGVLFISEEGD
jgi:co-chaperonin GroES (HSP10)